ncbi:MAG: M50 family metallopeptidase, partial [Oscillospiraceae bacterium]
MGIIYTILIFGVIIFIHELGHFVVAKLSKVTIHEFSLGMGPAIFKKTYKDTLYAIRLFPIGGYVSMEGEDSESDDENAFPKKPIWKRMLIITAGAIMNLLLGFAIMLGVYSSEPVYNSATIAEFTKDATTQSSGLMSGDKIVEMNKTNIWVDKDIIFEIMRDKDGIVDMKVIRNGKKVNLNDVKFNVTGTGSTKDLKIDFNVVGIERNFFTAIDYSFKNACSLARNSWCSIADLFKGTISVNDLSGPVGVGKVVTQASNQGIKPVLLMAAFISISVGMFNLLPLPALDGGRFVFLIIEA